MSAPSGIEVTDELKKIFGEAVDSKQTRFIKVSIVNEALVHTSSIPVQGSFQEDLQLLDSEDILQANTPAYLLTKLDDNEWLVIYFVPDTAKVREKMLYASSRASLLKSLGSSLFTDSIFATSKADLTPEAYTAHRRHVTAPKPLSASEQEMADVRAAERQAGGLSAYQGSRARTSHIGQTVGMAWAEDLQETVKGLGEGDDSVLVVLTIDIATETVVLHSSAPTSADQVGSSLPADSPSYAFFAWKHSPSLRDIVYLYSCPSGSPVKQRMVYASGFHSVYLGGKTLLEGSPTSLHTRKFETSTPSEINEAYLRSELDLNATTPGSGTQTPIGGGQEEQKKPFARPRGPKRR
ncbi:Protein tyrosine kinase [Mycena indigotica]|uniref:Protein tyrosine kinase n=1 Tax=Mycena indigotica TaxID=2126181 RepID=A0A8H6SBN3_9AGAR|nr:Protein tyrosine kinase [Mycena indigotica]KAF7295362.1 Protein tyrosine kinase [Mycena indigotica]